MAGMFVVGTDTGVGKTLASTAMMHALRALGHRVVGMKPVAAGATLREGEWFNEDVSQLIAASSVPVPSGLVNPYLFREAIAPHIAAERKGVRIEIPRIVDAYQALASLSDWVVVEGVGGFRVPLDARRDTADLAVALGLPVLLVVGMRLGCLNHALLTAEAMTARGLRVAAWVANRLDPEMAAYDENLAALAARLDAPCIAEFPWMAVPDAEKVARLISPAGLCKWLASLPGASAGKTISS